MQWLVDRAVRYPRQGQLVEIQIRLASSVFQIYLDPYEGGDRPSFFEVLYETGLEELPSEAPALVIDAGAHIGLFSLLARAKYPHAEIHAFEPLPRNIYLLKRHMMDNSTNVVVHQQAVWTEEAELKFVGSKSNDGHLATNPTLEKKPEKSIVVQCAALEKTLPQIRDGHVLLKLDIEGAELDVLNQALPLIGESSTIFCELHNTKETRERFSQLVDAHAWRALALKEIGPHSYWKLTSP